jgi:hypothetical protein
VLWSSNVFTRIVTGKLQFSITIQFTSAHNGDQWHLSNVYDPCHEPERSEFINWFRNCDVTDSINWLFLGDFNFYRSLDDRNKPRGNINDTIVFNDAIYHLGLI